MNWLKPKIDPACPDHWTMTVQYLNGHKEDVDLVWQGVSNNIFEAITTDDIRLWIPMASVASMKFDKNFSKVLEGRKAKTNAA